MRALPRQEVVMRAGRLVAEVAVPVVVASALLPVPVAHTALSVTVVLTSSGAR